MLGGRKITATLTGETPDGSVAKCCAQRDIVLPHSCEAWLLTNSYGDLMRMAVIHWGMHYPNQQKFPNTVSQLLKEALSMEQQWGGKTQLSIHA